jgi:diguanylate cyclase (GGDEF)-like protein
MRADPFIWWPEEGKEQRLRRQRVTLAIAASAVTVGITYLVAWAGHLPYEAATIYAAMVALYCVGFYAVIRSGLNLRFADPSLTAAQLVAAGIAVSYLIYEGGEARPAFLAMYLVAYMFGIFSLSKYWLITVALFYLACYVSVLGLLLLTRPASVELDRELFRIGVFAVLLGWSSYLGIYVRALREHLRRSTEELKQALVWAEDLATKDSLTKCFNRRRMLELLDLERQRAERGSALSVCLIDIDHFKVINDSYGHLAGDEVLKQFADVVQGQLRGIDSLARYGGEEFLTLLPQTGLAGAEVVAERVRRAVEAGRFSALPVDRRVTVSIGVAEHRPPDQIDRTLARADAALYDAKRQGRNCAVCAN